MHHIRIDTDTAEALNLSDLKRNLAMVAAGMDARFVRAGSTLSTAIETIDRIIHSIDGVTGALDESVAGIAVSSLKSVAGQLDALPVVQAGREADMARIGAASRVLRDHVMDMRQALRVLHIYGMNIKIAASGEAAFVGFVNDMGQRLATGEEHLEGFLAKLKELSGSVGSVQQAGRLLAAEARKILPAVPQRLTRDADALNGHLGDVASMARQVAEIARTVQGRVATMLGALQVGDSTRQRLEHVVSGLQLLDGQVVQVGGALFERFGDDQIAVVVAHELAHAILRHRVRLEAAGVKWGLLSEFGRNARLFRQTETEADLLGAYLLRNAGWDPQLAVRFWREYGSKIDGGMFHSRTHPSAKDRASAIERELATMPNDAPVPYQPPLLARRDERLN